MRKRNKKKQKWGRKKNKKKEQKQFVEKERRKGKEKGRNGENGKWRISRHSMVRVLKLVHAARSTCGHQKLGVSTNSIR